MTEIINSIKAFLYDRTTSPLFGAFLVSWCFWNYKFLIIIFSGEAISSQLFHIDVVFSSVKFIDREINGTVVHGFIVPLFFSISYIYGYPLISHPVYEYSLKMKLKLRDLKQKNENKRLLSVEESRDLLVKFSELNEERTKESEVYRREVSSLKKTIEDLRGQLEKSNSNEDSELLDKAKENVSRAETVVDMMETIKPSKIIIDDYKRKEMEKQRKSEEGKRNKVYDEILSKFIGLPEDGVIGFDQLNADSERHVDIIKHYVDELMNRKYLAHLRSDSRGQKLYGLTPDGRRYLLQRNLIPEMK